MADDIQKEILAELREIKELIISSTNDGAPIASMVPSSDFIAAVTMAGSLLAKEQPNMTSADIEQRIRAAMQLAVCVVRDYDSFSNWTRNGRLELLLHDAEGKGND